MAHSPHRRWRSCRVCKPYRIRGAGRAYQLNTGDMRKLGKRRRISRHDLGDALDC